MSQPGPIVIVDYGMGNLRSVQKKLLSLNATVRISADPSVLAEASKLVLPGVGHFANGVRKLNDLGLWDVLNRKVLIERTPILGICLGMQLMARWGEEGNTEGLGWLDADVVRFAVSNRLTYKVPHMGWNSAKIVKSSGLFTRVPPEAMFYFVHSYHMVCRQPQDVLALTTYEYAFTSVIQKENIYGTQFHPEKSHDWGQRLLANFLSL